MIRFFGVGLALAMLVSAFSSARAADVLGERLYEPAPYIVVPDCLQNRPPVGLTCAPRADLGAPDPRAVRASVDLDKRSLRRPYRQLFSWGP